MGSCGSNVTARAGLASAASVDDSAEIVGEDADKVFAAIETMGVIDADGLIGAANLKMTSLRCMEILRHPSGEAPKASCEYKAVTDESGVVGVRKYTGVAAATLVDILGRYGASTNGGINGIAVSAKSLTCSMPVIPNPVATCFLGVNQ
jgi:hypothetical protein